MHSTDGVASAPIGNDHAHIERIQAREAAAMLGVHPSRISVLIRQGKLTWRPDPLNARVHPVDAEQVQSILDERRELYV
jgi:hypothetical protein